MKYEDQDIKDFLQYNLSSVSMSEGQKSRLQTMLAEQLKNNKQNFLKRMTWDFRNFLNTTYEISLEPVLAFSGAAIVVVAMWGVLQFSEYPTAPNRQDEIFYIQQSVTQPDGSTRMVYTPVYREGS